MHETALNQHPNQLYERTKVLINYGLAICSSVVAVPQQTGRMGIKQQDRVALSLSLPFSFSRSCGKSQISGHHTVPVCAGLCAGVTDARAATCHDKTLLDLRHMLLFHSLSLSLFSPGLWCRELPPYTARSLSAALLPCRSSSVCALSLSLSSSLSLSLPPDSTLLRKGPSVQRELVVVAG